jgi:hypothetical protein
MKMLDYLDFFGCDKITITDADEMKPSVNGRLVREIVIHKNDKAFRISVFGKQDKPLTAEFLDTNDDLLFVLV